MNKRIVYFLVWICTSGLNFSQKVYQFEEPLNGKIFLVDTISIPLENAGYTLLMPGEEPDGVIIFFNSNRNPLAYIEEPNLEYYATKKNLAVLYVTTGNRLEFLFSDSMYKKLDNFILKALNEFNLPKQNLFFAGMSLAGTRAIKFALYSLMKENSNRIIPKAIAVCDSPLDFVRFWKEAVKARNFKFNPLAANEGAWVSGYLENNLGGTADENLSAYIDYSPYSYSGNNDKLKYLIDVPIRAYTEPDVLWWMKNRRKDFYGMNSIDLAAFVNELNIRGNESATLITSSDKGYLPDGTRHPHSWSIVDNNELINWFLMNSK